MGYDAVRTENKPTLINEFRAFLMNQWSLTILIGEHSLVNRNEE